MFEALRRSEQCTVPRMRRSFLGAAALAVAVLLPAATAAAQDPTDDQPLVAAGAPIVTSLKQTVTNSSSYQLRVRLVEYSEAGTLVNAPAAKLDPGDKDTVSVTTPSPVNGVALLVAYDAYNVRPGPDKYVGTILARSQSNCTSVFFLRPVCLNYAADNRAVPDAGGALRATWTNNGSTSAFDSKITILDGSGKDRVPGPISGYEIANDDLSPEEQAEVAAADDNGADWAVLPSTINQTKFTFRLNHVWWNEQAEWHATPPGTIAPGQTGFSHLGNDAKFHGVATLLMWDLFDGDSWKGTVFVYAADKCGFSVIKLGCLSYQPAAEGAADARGLTTLRVMPNDGDAPRYTRPQYFFSDASAKGED
jgi:hypothetical protein